MSIKIKTSKIKGYLSLDIYGEIVGDASALLTAKINRILKKNIEILIINLSNVTIIDSYGLGAFVYIWKQFSEENRKLIFLCEGDFDINLFSNANLDKLFRIVTSREEI